MTKITSENLDYFLTQQLAVLEAIAHINKEYPLSSQAPKKLFYAFLQNKKLFQSSFVDRKLVYTSLHHIVEPAAPFSVASNAYAISIMRKKDYCKGLYRRYELVRHNSKVDCFMYTHFGGHTYFTD